MKKKDSYDDNNIFESAGGSYVKLKSGHIKNITTKEYKRLMRIAPGNLLMDTDVIFDILDRLQRLEKRKP